MKQVLTTTESSVQQGAPHQLFSSKRLLSKYSFILLLSVIALFVGGCTKETTPAQQAVSSTDELSAGGSARVAPQPKKTVPFLAEYTTTLTVLIPGEPGGILEHDLVTGIGKGTPVGKTTFISYTQSDIYAPAPQLVTGTGSIIAENGDSIFVNIRGYASNVSPKGIIKIVINQPITGGTGIYAHATGDIKVVAEADIYTPIGYALYKGTISY